MKKTILCAGLISVLCSASFADNSPTPVKTTTQPSKDTIPTVSTTQTNSSSTLPATIDCSYRIPAKESNIDSNLILRWAQKATQQSFSFDYKLIDDQLKQLKLCYTDQGWTGFNDALEKSGNVNAIKSQQLTVSSIIDGQPEVVSSANNQWKLILPMKVTYQNSKEKLSQLLTVNLVIGRKVSGDLGIMQLIAAPRQATTSTTTQTAPATTTTTTTGH